MRTSDVGPGPFWKVQLCPSLTFEAEDEHLKQKFQFTLLSKSTNFLKSNRDL